MESGQDALHSKKESIDTVELGVGRGVDFSSLYTKVTLLSKYVRSGVRWGVA